MKKYLKKVLLLIGILVFSINAQAYQEKTNEEYNYLPYIIENYHVKIDVSEKNIFEITETIDVNFNQLRHGIIRNIPYINKVRREDGSESKTTAIIKKIKVNDKFTKNRSSGILSLKIGNPDKVITGKKQYVISYTYDLGPDKLKDKDELYFNIIGTQWDTKILKTEFEINMPKEFEKEKLGFSVGTYGFSGYNENYLKYEVLDNKIKGTYNYPLNKREGITVRLELEEGYFKGERKNEFTDYLPIILSPIFLIIAIIKYRKDGKNDDVVEVIEFYPPDDKNSIDVAFLYNGFINNNDVISLLIYLANKGYIEIIEGEKKFLKSKEFTFKKLKEYDGDDPNEKSFMDGLFKKKDTVKLSDLKNNFYKTSNKIVSLKNCTKNKNELFPKSNNKTRVFLGIMIIILIIISVIKPIGVYLGFEYIPTYIIFSVIINLFIMLSLFNNRKKKLITIIFTVLFINLFVFFLKFSILYEALSLKKIFLIGFIFAELSKVIIYILGANVNKRTDYGNKMLGRIEGFKTFLETAEKNKLEALVEENPKYFYDILPYTYVLGVSDKWIKKFEDINIGEPDWYYGPTVFNYNSFNNSMKTMTTQAKSYAAPPSSSGSSSGGFSGGGFSGGGSGGGGGSSW